MATTRRAAAWQNFVRSNWITAVWNWLLGLVGKAAEAVLAVTILYSTVQVFTTTDPRVDLGMFLAQQAALDIGGLGLIKLANQAKRDGLQAEAAKARKVSIILMVLMVIGVIVANVESKITTEQTTFDAHHHLITTVLSFQQSYPLAAIIIEILLLIARGTMAVVYGFTIHDLASSQPEQQPAQPAAPAADVNALITSAIESLQTNFEQSLNVIVAEQAQTRTAIQQIQTAPVTVPTFDTQAIIQAVITELVPQFQAKFQAVDQALFRQNTTITEVANQAKHLPELVASLQQIQAKRLPENAASQAAPKQPFQARPVASNQARQAEQNVIRLVPANASREELIAEAKRLRDVEGLSTYAIGEKLGKPAKTVQSWLSKDKDQAESEVSEVAN